MVHKYIENAQRISADQPIQGAEENDSSTGGFTKAELDELLHSPQVTALRAEISGWTRRAEDLARWTLDRMVIRADVYGKYAVKSDGSVLRYKKQEPVDLALLVRHFNSDDASHVIGLYTTSPDDRCLWLCIDLDRHDGDPQEHVAKNWNLALHVCTTLEKLGLHPLLLDSNGVGGLHLFVFFSEPVPARQVRTLGLWLVRDWQEFGLPKEPEVFPKQDSIGGRYGNFVRLFGLHHKRRFYSKAWDGEAWQKGEAAIEIILGKSGDPVGLIPQEALDFVQPCKSHAAAPQNGSDLIHDGDEFWKEYQGDLRTLDILGLFEARGLEVWQRGEREFEVVCPWTYEHTTGDSKARLLVAEDTEGLYPSFHCFHDHCKDRHLKDVLGFFGKQAVEQHCGRRFGTTHPTSDASKRPVIAPHDSLDTARTFYERRFSAEGAPTLFHHLGQWYLWDGRRYVEVSEEDMRATTWNWLASCNHLTKATKTEESKLLSYVPNRSAVTSTLDALKAVANLPGTREMPCWLGEGTFPQPENVIAFANGLLDLEEHVSNGQAKLLPHTPRWFSTTCLPHQFDPAASCPQWLEFLKQVLEDDQERIKALAQWFGYCLTCDNRQQKFALLIGPPRSGKGTTMSVLTRLLGSQNVANPSLTSLGSRFGLAPLVGKQAAIIGDAHLSRTSDAVAILERLKSIVGGDPQNVDRKGKAEMTNIPIKARFTISVNELPRLPDASAALRSRLLLLPFGISFEGKEDLDLLDRLLQEVPGITNWALEGLRDLRQAGRLHQPQAGHDILADFVRLSSPVKAFLDDWCELGPDKQVLASHLQTAWQIWCEENGHEPGSVAMFGARLRAAAPGVQKIRRRSEGSLVYYYQGVNLTSEMARRVDNRLRGLPT